jgi:hypothetical protein
MSVDNIKAYLEENPRMMGVLFMMMLLLSQAGSAAAGMAYTYSGP